MVDSNAHIDDMNNAMLKKKTLSYLPRNLGDIEAQRKILMMLCQVVPSISSLAAQADKVLWPKVTEKAMPVGEAAARCAFQVEKFIGTVNPDGLHLNATPQEALMQAWIALDYYGYLLKVGYSANIHNLQDQISRVLLANPAHTEMEDYGPTAPAGPVDDYGPTAPADSVDDYGPTAPAEAEDTAYTGNNSAAPYQATVVQEADAPRQDTDVSNKAAAGSGKKNRKPALFIGIAAAAVLVIVLSVFGFNAAKISKVENAIRDIGTVTMESGEQISLAEQLLAGLSESQQEKVDNRVDLTSARAELERLERLVQEASDAIGAIGTVELTDACGSRIDAARKAYDDLAKDGLQAYLADKAGALLDAENEYMELVCDDLYVKGKDHYDNKRYDEALACFDTILTDYPESRKRSDAEQGTADCQIALANKACTDRKLYDAMTLLKAVDERFQSQESYTQAHDKLITALERARPINGASLEGKLNWGRCYVKITAADKDICVKIENTGDPSKFKTYYIRAGQTYTLNMEDGTYTVEWATGDYWYDTEHLFGDDTECMRRNKQVTFITTRIGNTIEYWHLDMEIFIDWLGATAIDPEEF